MRSIRARAVLQLCLLPPPRRLTLAMATLGVAKKYTTLAPTVRTLASGVPAATGISFRHVSSGDHGHDGARHTAPSSFAVRISGGSKKSFITRAYLFFIKRKQ